jgi:predicted enzyme related to lactoylglutathione lyase
METDSYQHGVPSWVDLSTPDPERASAFYGQLFGWTIEEGPPEAGGYRMCMLRGKPVAGLGPQMNPGAPPAWTTYVTVASADDATEAVKAAGGQAFMPPMDVLDVGRMAIFADPAGAVFAVWQPGLHKGAGIVNEPNTYCWSELVTIDVEGAKVFYKAVFGWAAESYGEGGPGGYTEWKLGDRTLGGMMAKPPTMPAHVPPHWMVYFAVDDTDDMLAKITTLGGTTIMGAMDIEPGRFAVAADPAGAVFSILKLAAH